MLASYMTPTTVDFGENEDHETDIYVYTHINMYTYIYKHTQLSRPSHEIHISKSEKGKKVK